MPQKAQTLTGDLNGAGQWVGWPTTQQIMGVDDSYSVSVTGTFTGTLSLQRSLDGGTTWGNLDTTTGPVEWGGHVSSGCLIRAGFDIGSYSAGSAHVIMKVGQ